MGRSGKVWVTSELKEELKKDGGGNKQLTCIALTNKRPQRTINPRFSKAFPNVPTQTNYLSHGLIYSKGAPPTTEDLSVSPFQHLFGSLKAGIFYPLHQ